MPADPLIHEMWPHLGALVDTLEALDSTAATVGTARDGAWIAEALKAHEKRGGSVPWK